MKTPIKLIVSLFSVLAPFALYAQSDNPALDQYQALLSKAQKLAVENFQKALQKTPPDSPQGGPGAGPGGILPGVGNPTAQSTLSPTPPRNFAPPQSGPVGNPWSESASQNSWGAAAQQNPWAEQAQQNRWAKPQAAPQAQNPASTMQPTGPAQQAAQGSPPIQSPSNIFLPPNTQTPPPANPYAQ